MLYFAHTSLSHGNVVYSDLVNGSSSFANPTNPRMLLPSRGATLRTQNVICKLSPCPTACAVRNRKAASSLFAEVPLTVTRYACVNGLPLTVIGVTIAFA